MAAKTPNRELIKEILACQRSNERPKIISDTLAMMLMNMIENFTMKGSCRATAIALSLPKEKGKTANDLLAEIRTQNYG